MIILFKGLRGYRHEKHNDFIRKEKNKLYISIIIMVTLFSDLGLPGIIHLIKISGNIYNRLSQEPQYKLHILLISGEFIVFLSLLIYLMKILCLTRRTIVDKSLVNHMNKIIYMFILGGILSILHDSIINLDTGFYIMNLPISGRSSIIFICMLISYVVRYICKYAVEIKDYQDLTI